MWVIIVKIFNSCNIFSISFISSDKFQTPNLFVHIQFAFQYGHIKSGKIWQQMLHSGHMFMNIYNDTLSIDYKHMLQI